MKKVNIITLLMGVIVFCNAINTSLQAQTVSGAGCASVNIYQIIGNDTIAMTAEQYNNGIQLTCDTAERKLIAIGFAPGQPEFANGYYTYEKIAYDPPISFNSGSRITLPNDDCWSKIFSFDYYFPVDENSDTPGFTFFFYDKSYNTLVANSNGGVVFFEDLSFANQFSFAEPTTSTAVSCPYATSLALPNSSFYPTLNSINGPFQDIHYGQIASDNTKGMFISFIGEYPCRMCVISMNEIPNYGATGQWTTSMIVLYETTNVIEFYIKHKDPKTSTNGSNAILGINNEDGTYATTITNNNYSAEGGSPTTKSYNNTVWAAYEEAWRIKPTGNLQSEIKWYKKNTQGAQANQMQTLPTNTSFEITAAPTAAEGPTWYYAEMNATRMEDGKEFTTLDSILIYPLVVPDIVITHNSATDPLAAQNNEFSTSDYDTVCAGDKVLFTFTGGDKYYFEEPANLVEKGIVNGTVTVDQPADAEFVKYKFRIENYDGEELLCARYKEVYIYNRKLTVEIGDGVTICQGDSVTYFDTLHINSGSYEWKYGSLYTETVGNSDTLTYSPTSSGTLTLTLTDNRNCKASDNAAITVTPTPTLTIEGRLAVCEGTSTTLTAVSSSPSNNSYLWDDGQTTASVTVSPNEDTEYEATVFVSSANCKAHATATVIVVNNPNIHCLEDTRICMGDNTTIGVSGVADRFLWNSTDITVDGGTQTQFDVSPDATTIYEVHAFNNDTLNCESSDQMTVFVERKPVPSIFFSPDAIDELTPVMVFTDSTAGVTDRMWTLSDGAVSTDKIYMHTFDINDTTTGFTVTLTDWTEYGCYDSASVFVYVVKDHHIWAPTGVYLHATNPDNRQFRLHINALLEFNLKIFDRWGGLLFESDDIEQAWDCTYKGSNVQQGVYTWIASYRHTDSPDRVIKKSGTFMVYN